MFGYITADRVQMDEAQLQRYCGCYCGLCRTLQQRHGLWGRLTLNYDMTFLVLVLSSLYEPEEQTGEARCPVHPVKKRPYWTSSYTDYAADLNVLLAWWNFQDDWEDEKKVSGFLGNKVLAGQAAALERKYPRQSKAIRECLEGLHRFEAGEQVNADRAANCFGQLMGELFVVREEDYWAPTLRRLGHGLGQFIYIMDACIDLEQDEKKNRPNPLLALGHDRQDRAGDYALLSMLLSEATEALERLPLIQDLALMRNILYAGVWQRYNQAFFKEEKQGNTRRNGTHDRSL